MTFDQSTRNRLARFVGEARALLSEEFTRQLQLEYRMDPASGEISSEATLAQLDDARRETARLLRETAEHYLPGFLAKPPKERKETLDRIVREQAFTVLNRLCALRMAEARGLLLESIGNGFQSKGFQLYARVAGPALGETGAAYRWYLFSVFDELAVDLPVLFDRFSPQGRLFPRETSLLALITLIDAPEIAPLWAEDETIGWIYQYFNTKEERKKMRDESATPRNSRELAVRNQFFTPRYVVEFLADNTLGRTWYEMTQGQTSLVDICRYLVRRPNEIFLAPGAEPPTELPGTEDLSQEELLKQPIHIPYRAPKDPRSILMLDPACGSMHFGLYAFDLFERVYAEAWDLEAEGGPTALERPRLDPPLMESYPNKESLLRDVPRLIVERNIHGVDIDPRAVQIAGLSLWLRAQKSWRDQGLKSQDRPQIRRSNVVCAEPMPGDRALLEEFIGRQLAATPEDRVIAGMVRRVFVAMALAGEAGLLLKIEDEITAIVGEARRQWQAVSQLTQSSMFPNPSQTQLDVGAVTDGSFWVQAEDRIYAALSAYASEAENGEIYRRRLFADDAARGFAFIDLCRRRYDVVLMNPPFGSPSLLAEKYLHHIYPEAQFEIYGQFLIRASQSLCIGFIGAITSRGFLFSANFLSIRTAIYPYLYLFMDLGSGVLDGAFVEVCSFVLNKKRDYHSVHCIDARKIKDEFPSDIGILNNNSEVTDFDLSLLSFLPIKTFCYDTPAKIIRMFGSKWTIEPETNGIARVGLATGDNERFVRCYWEIQQEHINRHWVWHAKGGEYLPFKLDLHLVVDWFDEGRLLEISFIGARIKKTDVYFRPGITYSRRSLKGLSFRILPSGAICGEKGPAIITPGHEFASLALLNSTPYKYLIEIQSSASAFEIGAIQRTPIPENFKTINPILSNFGRELVDIFMHTSSLDETDIYFTLPKIVLYSENIRDASFKLNEILQSNKKRVHKLLEDVDDLVFSSYGWPKNHHILHDYSKMTEIFDIDNMENLLCKNIISICIGISIKYISIESITTPIDYSNPFQPLPQESYVTRFIPLSNVNVQSHTGILADDEGHPEDIAGRVREAITVIWGERADAIEQEAVAILGVRTMREYFRKPANFFADHLARYSKSRRQAPIYWPLATPSGSYTLWLYYHRLTDQTLYSCVNDFVEPKLRLVAEQGAALRQQVGRSSKDEKELERLTELERELRDFRDELLRVAAFWTPNLNDGVQITAAPLWRLFQLKPWQKKLKETWTSLEAGEYDWAHLAYSIWPERVREKCRSDRSLAIAHDLEELYIAPSVPAGKKKRGGKQEVVQEEMSDDD